MAHCLIDPLSEKLINDALIFVEPMGVLGYFICISGLCAPDFSKSNLVQSLTIYRS